MARRSVGIPGAAVAVGTLSLYLVYAGVTDVGVLEGLRTLLRGEKPSPAGAGGSSLPWRTLETFTGAAGALGATFAAAATAQVASTDPSNWAYNLDPDFARNLAAFASASQGQVILRAGAGWRSSERQMELRRAHCPDPVNSPASACTPPTAKVGTSNHERRPAKAFDLDFAAPRSRSVGWAHLNAARYHIRFPLRTEDWHAEPTGVLLRGGVG